MSQKHIPLLFTFRYADKCTRARLHGRCDFGVSITDPQEHIDIVEAFMKWFKFSGTVKKYRQEHNVLVRPPLSFSSQVADPTTPVYGGPLVHLARVSETRRPLSI